MNSKIFLGEVMHTRLEPVKHNFRYPVYFYAFDIDELPELASQSAMFGYNQLRPVAVHDRDYLIEGPEAIRDKLSRVLEELNLAMPLGKVILVTAARYFNYVFNPVSFFYCHDKAGRLSAILAQVNNTFGEMHLYPLSVKDTSQSGGRFTFRAEKKFHVSPFFPRQGYYEFHLTDPGVIIDNTIRYHDGEKLLLVARINGRARPLTSGELTRTIIKHPVCATLTMPRILWQAARLHWQRRLPVYEKPVPESSMTIRPVPPSLIDRLGKKVTTGFLSRLTRGQMMIKTPDGREHHFGTTGATPCVQILIKENRFFRRVMFGGDIGFGEAYTDGDWSTPDLPALLTLLASCEDEMNDRSIVTSSVGRVVNFIRHLQRPNTVKGSSRNIREHYDLSNEFFKIFLDPSLTYSCAVFRSEDDSLEQAQKNKLQMIIEKAGLSADDHVLEIGCGWGSFAIEAARQTGCRVTGITVSREQQKLALKRVREAGLEDRIEIQFCDYRHIKGQYSRVVSIEMLEAVGHAGLKPFFAACNKALLPGGRAVIQVITIPDRKYRAYRFSSDWIRKHIFPGGHLPSVEAMQEAVKGVSSLQWSQMETFGLDYARTLDRWRQVFLSRQNEIVDQGFDKKFIRTWDYYFAYCQAGFSAQIIDLAQIVLCKPEGDG